MRISEQRGCNAVLHAVVYAEVKISIVKFSDLITPMAYKGRIMGILPPHVRIILIKKKHHKHMKNGAGTK